MDKSPDAFRTISEVAETLDVPPHVLRFWESRFTQVRPVKRGGGRRYYRPEDVRLLRGIRGLLYDDGMTIKGVQKILRERGVRHVVGLGTLPEGDPSAAAAAPRRAAPPRRAPAQPAPAAQPDLFPAAAAGAAEGAVIETSEGDVILEIEAEAATETETAVFAPAAPLTDPERRAAMRALVAELEALRTVMVAED